MTATVFDLTGYVRAWNEGDLDGIVDYYAEDARVTRSSVLVAWEGHEGIRQGIGNYLDAWSGLHVVPRNLLQDGNRVAVVLSYSGTHARAMELAPGERLMPSGRRVAHDIAHFLTLDSEGKILRDEGILDMLSFLGQLGASGEQLETAALRETQQMAPAPEAPLGGSP
ncbi:MAG TPA: nuclear transport factor 2 family protein [Candidatus Thermoplasmatota archaeon]|nr:nuclear transport factor 2 family protein [Candidatus Thermoplasmatota archaeon]